MTGRLCNLQPQPAHFLPTYKQTRRRLLLQFLQVLLGSFLELLDARFAAKLHLMVTILPRDWRPHGPKFVATDNADLEGIGFGFCRQSIGS